MKYFEYITIVILIALILLVNLSGCTKQETYPNKMNTIAEKLSQLKIWDVVFIGSVWVSVPC